MIQYYGYKTVYLFSEAALHAESGHGAVCVLHVRESLGLLVIYTHIRDDWHDRHSHPLAVSPGELHLDTRLAEDAECLQHLAERVGEAD